MLARQLNGSPRLDRQRVVDLLDRLKMDPETAYCGLAQRDKSAFWRAILQDDYGNPTPLEMVRVKKGNSQKSLGRWAVIKSPWM